MSTPRWFAVDPHLAWGFFGHRYKLYQETPPHEGHHALKRILDTRNVPYFIFTSNVDGHFAKVFPSERIIEYHGSINHLQCSAPCVDTIWQAHLSEEFPLIVDENIRAKDPIPTCKRCNKPARYNTFINLTT
jgi:NAD-dependent SIR2 family protein deacetylase